MRGLSFSLISFFAFALVQSVHADDAATLPENRWRLQWVSAFSFADESFDSDGNSIPLGSDFSQTISTSFLSALRPETESLTKALNSVQPGLGDDLSVADLGLKAESTVFTNAFVAEYGVTDRLSVGIILPVVYGSVSVKADSEPTEEFQAVKNKFPQGHPMRQALNRLQAQTSVQGLNSALTNELGYSNGLGSWSGTGLGDLELGGKYNYYKAHPLKMTLKSGLRIPTGRRDDPNELFDIAFGDGQFDLGVFHYTDYRLLSNLYFTWEAGYTAQLPHNATYRVPIVEGVDISPTTAKLTQDPGDIVETGLEANYRAFQVVKLATKYHYRYKFGDDYSTNKALNVSALESNTNEESHLGIFTLGYTNIPEVRAGRARFPFEAALFYRYPFAGENVTVAQSAGLRLKSYF